MSILIHTLGVIAIINVVTFFLAGDLRSPRASKALGITLPGSIAYVIVVSRFISWDHPAI